MIGFGFMQHGFAKLSKGPEVFATILGALGAPSPHLMARLTIFTEIGGGLAVFLSGLLPLVAVPMAAVLLVAMFTVHLPYGFSSIKLISVTPGRSATWSAGLRMCSSLSHLSCRPCYDRSRAAGYRQDHRPSGPRVSHARRIATGFEPIGPVPPMTTIFTACLACESLEDT